MRFLYWALMPIFIIFILAPLGARAQSIQCTSIFSLDSLPPWEQVGILQFGRNKGLPLEKKKSSVKTLSLHQVEALGIPTEPKALYFYNYYNLAGKWVLRLEPESISSAKFGVERFTQNSEEYFHSFIRLKLKSHKAARIYEQLPGGIGRTDKTNEIILSITFQGVEGSQNASSPGQAIAYFINGVDVQAKREIQKNMQVEIRDLKMNPTELEKMLKNYLLKADSEGGVHPFNFCKNNCTNNLAEVILNSLATPPTKRISTQNIRNSRSAERIFDFLRYYGLVEP